MRYARTRNSEEETLGRAALSLLQREKLACMLSEVLRSNQFYRRKLGSLDFDARYDSIDRLPLTTRKELEQDQVVHPLYGSNLTQGLSDYCRFHQTSGSTGRPLRWLDTAGNWEWLKRCWRIIFGAAKLRPEDRLLFPFSFGPFIGFWAAFETAASLGNLCIPAGGLTTAARLRLILDNHVTVVCCTPTYALRMAEVAAEEGLDIAGSGVRALIVAGEPGGHVASTRDRIEKAWNARVYDHTGMTEIGSLGFECHENPADVHLIESECIAEAIDPQTLRPVPDGQSGELVITNLGRIDSPVIRYRTGDHVRLVRGRCACGRSFVRMKGGIVGRIDDMFIVRGNNVFPSALEAVIRRFPEVAEFRVEVRSGPGLTTVRVEVEPMASGGWGGDLAERVGQAIHSTFNFGAHVSVVAPGTLPRFEMKARRFTRAAAEAASANI